jgi:hypothetical protein
MNVAGHRTFGCGGQKKQGMMAPHSLRTCTAAKALGAAALAHRAIGDETGTGEAAVMPGGMADGDAEEFAAAVADGRPDSTTTRTPTRTRL